MKRKIRGFCFHNFSSTVLICVQAHAQLGNCSTLQSWGRVHYARSTLRLFWLEGSLFASVKLSYRCSHLDYKEYLGLSPLRCERLTMENSLGTSSDQWGTQTSHQNLRAVSSLVLIGMSECFESWYLTNKSHWQDGCMNGLNCSQEIPFTLWMREWNQQQQINSSFSSQF